MCNRCDRACINKFLYSLYVQFKKTVISLILILSYSIGFAHNLIPHCTDFHSDGEHSESAHHNHSHHTHDDGNFVEENHDHVEHDDHFDDGYLDYLICLIDNLDHSNGSCNLECYTPLVEYKFANNEDIQSQDLEVDWIESDFFPEYSVEDYRTNTILTNSVLGIEQRPERAPPSTY